jgi:cytosine/adenosine deaminase-related metal-dependent hydrolase/ubiquinone/menaquinone biosynthesis C-methylase UbiE
MTTAMPSTANTSTPVAATSAREGFAAWAEVYDNLPNPLLTLEQRFLSALLPEIRGVDIVEIGCGTGRWLDVLASQMPSSLIGVDFSPEMVERARLKMQQRATILMGDATTLPLPDSSADIVLAPFVASYISELDDFTAEIARVARASASVYVSDLHAETGAACNWSRGFRVGKTQIEIPTYSRMVQEVIACFEASGFEVVSLLQPHFGLPEESLFQSAGKQTDFHAAEGRPAIYILQLKPGKQRRGSRGLRCSTKSNMELLGARMALGPDDSAKVRVHVENGLIASLGYPRHRRTGHATPTNAVNLSGYLVLPGLINSHDHLEFGLFPNLGRGPYGNAEEWATDIQHEEKAEIERQRAVPKDVRLWWGAIRNLLCGVTTVCHHNPLAPELLEEDFPVRILTQFGWAHSIAMDRDIPVKFQHTARNLPFILHAGEGVDTRSADEIFELDRMRALDDRTVLVHGLALTAESVALLNRQGAALVWCPTSNRFLFGQTHTSEVLARVDTVVLGSDSSLTAAGDLLDEVRLAHSDVGISPAEVYRMLFVRPRAVFRLQRGEGALRPGAAADLIAVRDTEESPAMTVVKMKSWDVELVVIGGRVQLASQRMMAVLPGELTLGLQALEVDGQIRWVRAPLGRLFAGAMPALGSNLKIGKKQVRHVCTAGM